jgi:predicted acylesterase/phospholipase RssA
VDLILSSGYLAFARHLGALRAIADRGIVIDAVVGTSSGAVVGALLCAGMPLPDVAVLLGAQAPIRSLAPSRHPWRGLLSTQRIADVLREHLPDRFEHLDRPFAVGVSDLEGHHRLLRTGPLLPALMASIAIGGLFEPVLVAGRWHRDGGGVDRLGYWGWRAWRPGYRAIVHEVQRTRGADTPLPTRDAIVVRSLPATSGFFSVENFGEQMRHAQRSVERQLAEQLRPRAVGKRAIGRVT